MEHILSIDNTKEGKIYFFGWTNIKWFIREMGKTLSGQDSYFTSKRCERFAFVASGLFFYFWYNYLHIATMSATDFVFVNSPLFIYAGYNLKQIQKEKSENKSTEGQVS